MSDSEGEWLSSRNAKANSSQVSQKLLTEKFGYKKMSMSEVAKNVSPKTRKVETPEVDHSPIPVKRKRNVILSSDEEDATPSKRSADIPRTFNGKSFDAVDRKIRKNRAQILSDSESDAETPLTKVDKYLASIPLPPAPSTKFEVKRRAVIVSSDESDDEEQITTLRKVAKKAKKFGNGKKAESDVEPSSADDFDEAGDADSYNSSDSDADEHRSKKEGIVRAKMRIRCLNFLNHASETELKCAPNYNDRFLQMILSSRPFDSYETMETKVNEFPRGAVFMGQYEEYIENRGILDQVLYDCRQQSEQIKNELEAIQNGLPEQPRSLNPSFTLYDYQKVGLNWLIMMHKLKMNAILADEMGLGKTIQIIAFLTYLKDSVGKRPHLVVVPSSTLENWMNEMNTWSPSLKFLTYYGSQDERAHLRSMARHSDHDLIITTYQMIGSKAEDRQFFKRFHFEYIVYDEAHMLRSCNTQRYQNLLRVRGRRKILLTGTPLQNNLVELISLMYFTMPKMFSQYCADISSLLRMFAMKNGVKCTVGSSSSQADDNEDEHYVERKIEQAKAILQPFVLRRLKTNVLQSLPKKYEKVEFCEMAETQRGIYEFVVEDIRQQQENNESQNPAGGLMRMRQAANHPLLHRRHYDDDQLSKMAKLLCRSETFYKKQKPDYVAEDLSYMSDIAIHQLCCKYDCIRSFRLDPKLALNSGKCHQLDIVLSPIKEKKEKVVLFSQFTSMLDVLELYLSVRGYKFCRLDGSTPVMERQELINAFNSDSSIFVFLLSTKAGGLGINLTAANHIIIHDIDFNPYNDKQAEDRCHRMGQEKEVMVTRLVSKGTVEEAMLEVAKKKLELEKNVTNGNAQDDDRLDSQTTEFLLTKAVRKHGA